MLTTTFFTACNRLYEPFALPYMASVLAHNPTAAVELCMEDPARFVLDSQAALGILADRFGRDRFLLREGRFDGVFPNSVRFLEQPEIEAPYTYIGDIDILILEEVTPVHLKRIAETGLPYSNIQRPNKRRLSGLHFTSSGAFYPQAAVRRFDLRRGLDEELLYRLVAARKLPLPDPSDTFRPVHGFHLSISRLPTGHPHWGLHRQQAEAYLAMKKSELWTSLMPHFHAAYLALLLMLDLSLQNKIPELEMLTPEVVRGTFEIIALR